jgi:cell division protein FtsL
MEKCMTETTDIEKMISFVAIVAYLVVMVHNLIRSINRKE